uniref:Uncharacterized protein n=1 Tax=Pipistrellus kuhlii TaxID=59472 RepID=A0A7J8B1W1_PIPKU|nr:hypothetical protein mPipKuh1_007690 [Pipistrellus kuhlii]
MHIHTLHYTTHTHTHTHTHTYVCVCPFQELFGRIHQMLHECTCSLILSSTSEKKEKIVTVLGCPCSHPRPPCSFLSPSTQAYRHDLTGAILSQPARGEESSRRMVTDLLQSESQGGQALGN